jgi:CubicO group peptidase (beta-lactamase class C family)
VPRDLTAVTSVGDEVEPAAAGMTSESVAAIWKSILHLYRSGAHPAIQLCLRRDGHVVLNRSIGHARGNGPADPPEAPKRPATIGTPFCVYSASKAITAMVVHMLDERGALHIGDRVSDYIPEYARHGKEATTIAHVLAHRAGVPSLPRDSLNLDSLARPEEIVQLICDSKPALAPGRVLAYHAVSGGFILGEVVRRVTGKTIREVLAQEILEPLGFRWTNFGVPAEDVGQIGLSYVTGPPLLPPLSLLVTRALGAPLSEVVELSNDPRFLTGIVPAGNTITTAEELSRFYELLRRGGELDGVRVMERRTIRRALAEQSYMEIDLSLGFPTRFSLGMMLGAKVVSLYGPDTELAFGHLGLINIMGWADPERSLSAALITSGKPIVYPELPRFYAVMRRIAIEVPKVPRSAVMI